jgi:hypothetical protein
MKGPAMRGEHACVLGAHSVLWESRPEERMSPQRSTSIAMVMFTDVEASTDMTTRLGDDATARCVPPSRGASSSVL